MRLPGSEEHGPSHGLRPPYRVSDRSLRPTRLRVDSSLGVLSPTTTSANRSGSPGFASPGTFRPQGFDPLAGLLPGARCRPEGRRPPMGFTLQGTSLRPAAPVSGPWPPCRFRLSLPSPLRTRRWEVPLRLRDIPPVEEPVLPGGRASLPGLGPRGSPVPLRSSRPTAMVPASRNLPSCAFPPEVAEATDDGCTPGSRSAARSGELSRVRRLP
jgi:hypothetical protein